ncbi:MAG: RloB domain-containing protein [Chryseobacterium sp.]|nr:MAG: RloB domain-containing protein [Chryseobacterium sp.]
MQYLNRKKIYEKQPPAKDAKKIYIFCEGAVREVNYFRYFEGLSSNIEILPIPCENDHSDPTKLMENAKRLFLGTEKLPATYSLSIDFKDEIWFVIDTDTWQEQGKISTLKNFCSTLHNDVNGWTVAQSNPCFEIWLLYHFTDQKPKQNEVDVCDSFKDYVGKKIAGGVDVRKAPLYLPAAINNSLTNFETDNGFPVLYTTAIHELGNVILPFISEQLQKAEKMIAAQKAASQKVSQV